MTRKPTAGATGAGIDTDLRAARGRRRLDPDTPPAPVEQAPADEAPPAPADLPDDELDELLHDRAAGVDLLADPAVRRRLAMRDPDFAAEMERWEGLVAAAEERAAARLEAVAQPRPAPLPGGGAAPVPPAPPSGEAILRAAIGAAKGEGVDHQMRPYVRTETDVTVTSFDAP